MSIRTVAVLAGRYRGKKSATLTHAMVEGHETTLCRRIHERATTEAPDEHATVTCPMCKRRDERGKTGEELFSARLLKMRS